MTDPYALKIATFVASALELDIAAAEMASEVIALKRDANAGISTIELQSADGAAPFLIYHYVLNEPNDEGRTGQDLFDQDLATLTRATERNTPGPRILAHAIADGEAYVLATTPEVFRALTGVEPPEESSPEPPMQPGPAAVAARKSAAGNLMRLLQEADAEASTWLRAIRATSESGGASEFEAEESALALFLLDSKSIKNVLNVMSILLENAQEQATKVMKNGESGTE